MQKHADITRQRISTYKEKRGLLGKVYPDQNEIDIWVYHAPDRVDFRQAIKEKFLPANVGDSFGPAWSTHWFRLEFVIPAEWEGHEVHLLWDSSSEACIWKDGQPLQGLTGTGTIQWELGMSRLAYRITTRATPGDRVELYVEMACNGLFGSEPEATFQLKKAEIALFDRDAWDLYWDFVVIADMANLLPPNSPRAGQALWTANEMMNVCQLDDSTSWPKAREIAAKFLQQHNGSSQHELSAIGYAHLDTAWLWPLAESKRKAVRTFSNTMRLMDDYPNYKFASAQAQHLAWVKELQPELYEQIKKRIREGRFIIVGGTWIEPDCNIPSGESLVRQFLHGQRFFRQEFGITCTEFWNPDVFGYSAALPQIMCGSEIKYFLTQKLSWNQMNKPANHTFIWEGIDGSQVLTHFPPADTYGSAGNVADVLKSSYNFKEHDRSKESLLIFGWGDGGGGPTPAMIEQLTRLSDVDGIPKVEIRSVSDFFTRCEADIKQPIVWVGELYFELHRGTYTTQAANKRDNRKSELLLRDVELICSIADVYQKSSYPGKELDHLWKLLLLNQFHDILPGSSINMVYKDSARHYAEILERGKQLQETAIRAVFPAGNNWAIWNTLDITRNEVVEIPFVSDTVQKSSSGASLAVVNARKMGITPFSNSEVFYQPVTLEITLDGFILENEFVKVTVAQDGSIPSLVDKRIGREAVAEGSSANRFVWFEDDPLNFEAWDVDIFHLEKRFDVRGAKTVKVIESGPLRAQIAFEYDISEVSSIKQTICLTAVSPRVDFETNVNWHENKKFLKVEFPWEIRSEIATYEIQFGHVQRPTHYNTTWDLARFEVLAHRWADLSEPGFGIALINDSKYGYSTYRNIMRLSLLRSPKSPDPAADMGQHSFKYAIFPHAGNFRDAGVIQEGYRFNVPLMVIPVTNLESPVSYFEVDHQSVIIDTIKKSEDGDSIIVRLYESFGGRRTIQFSSLLPVNCISRCNLLEESYQELKWNNGSVFINVKPFEVVTLKMNISKDL